MQKGCVRNLLHFTTSFSTERRKYLRLKAFVKCCALDRLLLIKVDWGNEGSWQLNRK
jgi:hypothetical protein